MPQSSIPGGRKGGVVVLGPYRSGTSIVSRVLERLGIDFGPADAMFQANSFNPAGFYERADINRANTSFIESAGFTLAHPGTPRELFARGDGSFLCALDLDWMSSGGNWGLKDPRLCATLLSWIEHGLIAPASLRVIWVSRDPEAVTDSVCNFPDVAAYCGGGRQEARAMTDRYHELAHWHVENVSKRGALVHGLEYEELIANRIPVIRRLADFLGVNDERLIKNAAAEIGKRKSLLKLLTLEKPGRLLTRAPAKLRDLLKKAR